MYRMINVGIFVHILFTQNEGDILLTTGIKEFNANKCKITFDRIRIQRKDGMESHNKDHRNS